MPTLTPLPARFDPSHLPTLRSLAWLARCGYYDADRLPDALAAAGLRLERCVKAGSMAAYVAASDAVTVVGLRGTDFNELRDILTDLRIKPVPCGAGRAHAGFVGAAEALTPGLQAALPDRPVWLVGHSLGGALAQALAATWMHPVDAVVAFGSPRVGDAAFGQGLADLLGDLLLRVTHDRDPVLDFPPRALGYRHAGPELRLHADGRSSRHRGIEGTARPPLREVLDDQARLHLIPHYEGMLDERLA